MDPSLFTRAVKAAARLIAALCLLGPAGVLVYLPLSLWSTRVETFFYDKGWVAGLLAGVVVTLLLVRRSRMGLALRRIVLVSPVFLSPLSLLFPWASVPGKLGPAVGGPELFWEWLTRYPTLGPLNGVVLAGTLCLLGVGFLPCGFAFMWLGGGRRSWMLTPAALALACWAPVAVRLDAGLIVTWFLGPAGLGALVAGPLLRLAAVGIMSWLGLIVLLTPRD